ncbi:hypothetical protein AHMF7605_09785 [Adhaeribacter arboris]|uniref:Novel STAND NTPase 3 domain-containing protein n=1 Tax=Adhaeribacter arboris TaxID=2072846 RepID=A0A2T2YE59_9BACT|nr:ATP-binding protein [Adhaeribacter arboris]PSR53791.1 hypothetical protein AHMF7605_09785 [Adhaeribacter arboris]
MARLQQIENRLKDINEVVFQELCDCYLALRNSSYKAFIRSGSQTGKQKTVKGTPDSFFVLPNGRYLFVEVTTVGNTRKGQLLKKLIDDIKKCLNEEKTGILNKYIQEIVLCFNSKLKTNEVEILNKLVKDAGVYKLTLVTLNELATQIHLRYRHLAKEYLNLSLDTGQLVSLEKFIHNYNNKGQSLATPLDNKFVHRETELKAVIDSFERNDLVILTGSPGVGKSKLALEGINSFLKTNLDYNAYAVLDKNYDIFEDLTQYFEPNSKNIVFIDDANRYDRLAQIVGFTKGLENGKLKVVLTVRDYALNQLKDFPFDNFPHVISISGFTDEQLTDIIKNKPFDITNSRYQKEILRIADGNPRLAIMTAKLALEKNNIYALQDVSDLFDQYFSSFIKDNKYFAKSEVLKVLGLIAFFNTLPYDDDKVLDSLLRKFKLDKNSFIDSIDKLEQLELIEIQFEHVKISEQNLATYFFYKVFIKDALLSFQDLLISYFETNIGRFRDTVIPANNTFGYRNVIDKIRSPLKIYWNTIQSDEDKAFKFLHIFWAYLLNESLEFVLVAINPLDVLPIIEYNTQYKTNDFTSNKNSYLELLSRFYSVPNHLQEAVELSFEYVRRKPKHLPELIKNIDGYFAFDIEDEDFSFIRQQNLFDFIIGKINQEDELYVHAFIAISQNFLRYQFNYTRNGRGNTIYIGRYPLPLTSSIQAIRTKIWQTLDYLFPYYPNECFKVVYNYSQRSPDVIESIMVYDLEYFLIIISKHFSSESFKHCFLVQEYARWLKRNGINNSHYINLLHQFNNPAYQMFTKIDRNRFRDKDDYELNDYEEYERLKEEEIRNYFLFSTREQFDSFVQSFLQIEDWEELRHSDFNQSLDLIIDENIKQNTSIGQYILYYILTHDRLRNYQLSQTILSIATSSILKEKFWHFIKAIPVNEAINSCIINFLSCLPEEEVNEEYISDLEDAINNIGPNQYIRIAAFDKFFKLRNNLFDNILNIILNKNENENFKIKLGRNFFEFAVNYTQNINLLKKAYLQQDLINNLFDYKGEELLLILNKDNTFLKDYLEFIFKDQVHVKTSEYKSLHIIWQLSDYSNLLDEAIGIICKKDPYVGFGENFANAFFQNLSEEDKSKADFYILHFIEKYNNYRRKMKIIFDVLRHSRKELFDTAFQKYISTNQNLENFKKISWIGNGGVYNGDIIIADIHAAEWIRILNLIEKSSLGIKAIPLKRYVQELIDAEKKSANWERKNKFLDDRD